MSYVDKEFGGSVRSLTVNSGQRDGVSPTMPAMPTTTKQPLRSKRGRPKGSFRDPALRAQAWHWLSELLLATGETDPRRLDDAQGKHGLTRGLPVGRRFTRVMEDGYDPRNISAGAFQLFDHVNKRRKFSQAKAAYQHPLFQYMQDRELGAAGQFSWIQQQLSRYGLTLLSDRDHMLGRALRLVSIDGFEAKGTTWIHDRKASLAPLTKHATRFATLDGIYLLVAIHRLILDTAPAAAEHARDIAYLILEAALILGENYRYGPEQSDTWRLLVETRLIRWITEVNVSESHLRDATVQLGFEFEYSERGSRGRPKLGPYQVGHGRAERRWRRWAHVRASLNFLDTHIFPWVIATRTVATEWIEGNSEVIEEHIDQIQRRERGLEERFPMKKLPPLHMPASVDQMRAAFPGNESFYKYRGQDIGAALANVTIVDRHK
jgi:hypothetical protein